MAGFLDIHKSEYASKDVAKYSTTNGNSGHKFLGYTLATSVPSLFMAVANEIENRTDGKGGSETSSTQKSFKKQKKALEKQLNEALGKLGIQDSRQINETVSEAQNRSQASIVRAQAVVDTFNNGTDSYSQAINELKAQMQSGEEYLGGANHTSIQDQINALETKKAQAKADAETNLKNTEATEAAKIKEIQENAEKAYEIFQKLSELVDLPDDDNDYVKEKNETLHEFNNQRTIFLTSTNPEDRKAAAQKIKEMAEDSNNANDKNMRTTYNLLRVRIDECLK